MHYVHRGSRLLTTDQVVDDTQVLRLPSGPAMCIRVCSSVGYQAVAQIPVLKYLKHGASECFVISRFKKPDHIVVEVILVNFRFRNDDWHSTRHELHNFCAVRFVSKRVSAFWNHSQVGVSHDTGDLSHSHRFEELHVPIESKFLRQGKQGRFHIPVAVDVKLRVRKLRTDFHERPQSYIKPLMPLEATWEDDDQTTVVTRARSRLKNTVVDIVDKNRAFPFTGRSRLEFRQPKIV